jgi:hypothetical protein
MVRGGEVEGSVGKVGGLSRVGASQGIGSLHQGGDGHLVTGHGARGELGGDLHGQRPGFQERGSDLAVEGLDRGRRQARAHRLPVQVVAEAQRLRALGQQFTADELADGVDPAHHLELPADVPDRGRRRSVPVQASELAAVLRRHVVRLTTLFWNGTGHHLGHEYQFNFTLPQARTAFRRMLDFLATVPGR